MSDDVLASTLAILNQTLRALTEEIRQLRLSLGEEEKPDD